MFQRLGPWMHDHKWWVIAAWVLVLVSANGVASSLGDAYGEGGDLPERAEPHPDEQIDEVGGDLTQAGQPRHG